MEDELNKKTIIHFKRDFSCKAETLFEAFLSAEVFRSWFCPPGFEAGKYSIVPVTGGEYKCELLKNGEHVLTINGSYIEIERYDKLVFTLIYEPDVSDIGECRVTIVFTEKDNITNITLNQEIYRTIDTEGRTKGWEFMFSKLEEILTINK